MDRFKRLVQAMQIHLFLVILLSNLLLLIAWRLFDAYLKLDGRPLIIALCLLAVALGAVLASFSAQYLSDPVRALWQAVLHVSPNNTAVAAPNLHTVRLGRELVTALSLAVYQLASVNHSAGESTSGSSTNAKEVLDNNPLPLFACREDLSITYANPAACSYLGLEPNEIINEQLCSILNISFNSEDTLERWLQASINNKITSSHNWNQARLKLPKDGQIKLAAMAVRYSKMSPGGAEIVISLFDQTSTYEHEEQSIGFIALAAHELRGPLTLLRGYIDVFDQELHASLSPELVDFMVKMKVAAGQLTAYVNTILQVARVEEGTLSLELREENWDKVIKQVLADYATRLQINRKSIEYHEPPATFPTAGVDLLSMYEVLSNLIDNAIKYSRNSPQKIIIRTELNREGLIQTTVQDSGVGIPENVLPHLFEKFYRSHRTQKSVGGTGLGLYLCRAIVEAHGGRIWAQSKESQGTTIGFTIQPYSLVASDPRTSPNTKSSDDGIVRVAHGWIKNHSLYRK